MVGVMKENDTDPRYAIRLVGLRPGTSEEDLVAAIKHLYRNKTPEQVGHLVKHLPAVLTDKATREIALKVSGFLKAKGAVLSITDGLSPIEIPAPAPIQRPAPVRPAAIRMPEAEEPVSSPAQTDAEVPPEGVERRAKPRVHPGIQIHPMGVGGILDHSFRLLRANFWLFFFIVFIPQAAFFVLSTGGPLLVGKIISRPASGMGIGFGVSAVIAFVIFMILQFWAQGALIHAVSETYLGHSTSVGSAYGSVRKKLLRLLGTLILLAVLVFIWPAVAGALAPFAVPVLASTLGGLLTGLIALIVGLALVWLTARLFLNWFLADKVVILEDEAWMSALRRSKELMNARTEPGYWKKHKNKAGLIVALGFLIAMAINLLFQLPGFGLSLVLPGLFAAAVSGLLNIIASSLATVYTATALIIFYYDIRLRKEGFDLKIMAQGLG